MPRKPIFDTNVFGHVQDGRISLKDWRFLLAHRPGHGRPLSSVTAVELLAGVHEVPAEKFLQQREQIELSYQLSKGRIHEEPRFLICNEVLGRPLPPEVPRFPVKLLARYLDVVRHASSRVEILEGKVPYKVLLTGGKGRAQFDPSVLKDLIAGPKRQWLQRSETFADELYPRWREHFQETGKRLPDELRKQIASRLLSDAERMEYSESFLRWMRTPADPRSRTEIAKRLDAVLEFTIFVTREFLTHEYNLEKHGSDVYDQFQLHYLAMDRFVLVSGDEKLIHRTSKSSQADRVMSFERFLQSL